MAEQVNEMQSKKLAGSKAGPATQRYLDISEIKDDVVIMKDGTLRSVLLVSSINFALKSEDEQNAIISQYVAFLNSLEFPLQVVIQSRKLNIDKYIDRLREQEKIQTNELLRMQIRDYRDFINPLSDKAKGFWSRLSETFSAAASVKLAEDKFLKRKQDLQQRVGHIKGSLGSMGLVTAQLDTQSLIELYYRVYNPETYDTEKMVDEAKIRVSDEITTV
jgi:TraC protein